MEPKEEADLLLITTRHFLHLRIYIFWKFHSCVENSPDSRNINRVTVTVELVLSVLICLDVEGTDQSEPTDEIL